MKKFCPIWSFKLSFKSNCSPSSVKFVTLHWFHVLYMLRNWNEIFLCALLQLSDSESYYQIFVYIRLCCFFFVFSSIEICKSSLIGGCFIILSTWKSEHFLLIFRTLLLCSLCIIFLASYIKRTSRWQWFLFLNIFKLLRTGMVLVFLFLNPFWLAKVSFFHF